MKSKVMIKDTENIDLSIVVAELFELFPASLTGKKVLVKPNMLGPFEPERGVTTNPEVLKAVVNYLLQQKAQVLVGDNPGGQGGRVIETAKAAGLYDAAMGTYVNVGLHGIMHPLDSKYVKEVNVSKIFFEVDYLINLPRFKTHTYAGFSGAIKNMFGIIAGPGKAKLHFAAKRPEDFQELLVDLYQIRVPDFTIVDGIIAMEGFGPTSGKLRPLNKLLASMDGVAIDTVMARMMGFDLQAFPMLQIAQQRGLGNADFENIEIIGDGSPIPDFEIPATYAAINQGIIADATPNLESVMMLYKLGSKIPKLKANHGCIQCCECIDNCPAQAMVLAEGPRINYKKCISCFCCAELCRMDCFEFSDGKKDFENLFENFQKAAHSLKREIGVRKDE